VRSGSTPGITPNFTGQRLDDTGLLFYNARYYDPMLGQFISADWIVPNAPALTVNPFGSVAGGTWGKGGGGPANAQDLNRYSYALNNPVRNTDPSGHCVPWCVAAAIGAVVNVGIYAATNQDSWTWGGVASAALSGAVGGALMVTPIPGAAALAGAVGGGIAGAALQGALATGVGIAGDAIANTVGAVVDQELPTHLNGPGMPQGTPSGKSMVASGVVGAADVAAISRVTDLPSQLSVAKGTNVETSAGMRRALFPRSKADLIRRGPSIRYNRVIFGRNIAASIVAAAVVNYTYEQVSNQAGNP
jgi:RHS repeat-associated protein